MIAQPPHSNKQTVYTCTELMLSSHDRRAFPSCCNAKRWSTCGERNGVAEQGSAHQGYNVASVNFCWPVVVLRKERFEGNAKALISWRKNCILDFPSMDVECIEFVQINQEQHVSAQPTQGHDACRSPVIDGSMRWWYHPMPPTNPTNTLGSTRNQYGTMFKLRSWVSTNLSVCVCAYCFYENKYAYASIYI